MAKKQKNNKQHSKKAEPIEKEKTSAGLLAKVEVFFESKAKVVFWLSFSLAALFSLLLFNFKVSVGGDDSAYIIRAFDFTKDFKYPSFQGPLYPILLSPFIALFGISLPILKFVSLACLLLAFFFFHKAYKDHIPATILYPTLLITATTAFLLGYGGQTYSEALFFMLQTLLYLFVFKFFIPDNSESNTKNMIIQSVIVGGLLFLSVLTKNIAFSAVIAVTLYLLISLKFKTAGLTLASFSAIYAGWEALKRLIWDGTSLQAGDQGQVLLQKHPYDASKGMEDFAGYLGRFWDNIQIYFSKYLAQFLGIRSFDMGTNELGMTSPFLGILVIILFLIALFFVFKQNKYLLFTGIYLAIFYGITFIVLQKIWDSGRMTIVYLPFTVLFLISGLYYMAKSEKTTHVFGGVMGLVTSFILIVLHKMQKSEEAILMKLLQGNKSTSKEIIAQIADYKEGLLQIFLYVILPILIIIFFLGRAKIKKMTSGTNTNTRKFLVGISSIVLISSISLTMLVSFVNTTKEVKENSANLKHNIKGDLLYGFSLDWRNYLEMTKYAAKVVPDSVNIGCRKPNIAFIYGERRFKGIYKVHSTDADTLLQKLQDLNVHYVIMASLRKYEAKKTKHTINTIKRYLYPIQKKYPGIFAEVQTIGNDEKAVLLRINYDRAKKQ